MHRLGDLIAEIRRQLKPLGRQAEVARRAVTIQAEVRDGRSRLLADDIVQAQSALEAELKDEAAMTQRRAEIEEALREARETEADLEEALREDAPALQAAQDTWYSLSGFGEQIKGTARIAADRIRSLNDEADEPAPGATPRSWSSRPPGSARPRRRSRPRSRPTPSCSPRRSNAASSSRPSTPRRSAGSPR